MDDTRFVISYAKYTIFSSCFLKKSSVLVLLINRLRKKLRFFPLPKIVKPIYKKLNLFNRQAMLK